MLIRIRETGRPQFRAGNESDGAMHDESGEDTELYILWSELSRRSVIRNDDDVGVRVRVTGEMISTHTIASFILCAAHDCKPVMCVWCSSLVV